VISILFLDVCKMFFSNELIQWYNGNKRDLPWRHSHDPYVIWLSEVILQQTRVQQGLPYFNRFLEAYPTVSSFAAATEEEILRHWQGLGYYSRARNMLKAARMVVSDFRGDFPSDFASLIRLPGIGDYTASAISSFAANEDRAVVDGNVFRVLSRFFGIETPINSPAGIQTFRQLALELMPPGQSALHNQAIMEFGALQCKPQNPDCGSCPFQPTCFAYQNQAVNKLPVKLKPRKSRNRYFHYFVIRQAEGVWMQQRKGGDIWENLFEFPMIETMKGEYEPGQLPAELIQTRFGPESELIYSSAPLKHILSHQNIFARFYEIRNVAADVLKNPSLRYVLIKDLDKLAKPKLMYSFIEQYLI
jgi:A/G-specific adenine glycosylase